MHNIKKNFNLNFANEETEALYEVHLDIYSQLILQKAILAKKLNGVLKDLDSEKHKRVKLIWKFHILRQS